jgi:hypothetical protein
VDQDLNITANFSINSYTLSIDKNGSGSVSGANSYTYGSVAQITATPSEGYSFSHWSGNEIANPTNANTSVIVDQDLNITANFSINSYTLFIDKNGSGSVSGANSYTYGSVAQITATPSEGYSFSHWSGNGIAASPTNTSTTITVDQDLNITANFFINSYTLSIDKNGSGSVLGANSYTYGSVAQITATPSEGYSFSHWSGNGIASPTNTSTTITVNQNLNITANFVKFSLDLNVSVIEGGEITTEGALVYGSMIMLQATAQDGWEFVQWVGTSVQNSFASSTSLVLQENSSVTAIFKRIPGFWTSGWIGYILQGEDGWMFHYPIGWLYTESTHAKNEYWCWHTQLGWLWFEKNSFAESYVWMKSSDAWIYIDMENGRLDRYYNYATEKWSGF